LQELLAKSKARVWIAPFFLFKHLVVSHVVNTISFCLFGIMCYCRLDAKQPIQRVYLTWRGETPECDCTDGWSFV
jgi:hypothetical protein